MQKKNKNRKSLDPKRDPSTSSEPLPPRCPQFRQQSIFRGESFPQERRGKSFKGRWGEVRWKRLEMSSRRERRLPMPQGKKKRGEREGGSFWVATVSAFASVQYRERKKYCSPLTLLFLPYLFAVWVFLRLLQRQSKKKTFVVVLAREGSLCNFRSSPILCLFMCKSFFCYYCRHLLTTAATTKPKAFPCEFLLLLSGGASPEAYKKWKGGASDITGDKDFFSLDFFRETEQEERKEGEKVIKTWVRKKREKE